MHLLFYIYRTSCNFITGQHKKEIALRYASITEPSTTPNQLSFLVMCHKLSYRTTEFKQQCRKNKELTYIDYESQVEDDILPIFRKGERKSNCS
ncbi:uncharacterized protein LOC111915143 isoform X3 [Lactuca sativa]|uniref:uncharacterized protein LOC111915143 isoform X3 n=1 Tax=Lactuca sativa TaxID=4236 RepID=UPI000CD98F0D|nr:uncharacterized protein LOC111915143 isoform X3 [Lactuca sativa]